MPDGRQPSVRDRSPTHPRRAVAGSRGVSGAVITLENRFRREAR